MLTLENGLIVLRTRYHAQLVAGLRALPQAQRRYRASDKTWVIAREAVGEVDRLEMQIGRPATQEELMQRTPDWYVSAARTLSLRVLYVGSAKERLTCAQTAYGFVTDWDAEFPEPVLRKWFNDETTRQNNQTMSRNLYVILGVTQDVVPVVLKTAYRRMAMQWHPDHCTEPDAQERFIRIKQAWDVLSDHTKRAKYDVGLVAEHSVRREPVSFAGANAQTKYGYRTPLRCGMISGLWRPAGTRLLCEHITAWDDITDARGRVLVTSWAMGADKFMETWHEQASYF